VSFLSAIFRNVLGKPGAADFRDSAEHFVTVLREQGISLTFARDELYYVDNLAERLAGHNEYRDALGCWLGEVIVRNFGGEWVPGHALGPAVRVGGAGFAGDGRSAQARSIGGGAGLAGDGRSPKGGASIIRHVFPLGWVYRRADGGEAESIAKKLHRELGFPEEPDKLRHFTDSGERA
jgi:hypothetical protein